MYAGSGRCEEACAKRLFAMRQARLLQGREMGRVERVWVITEDARPDPKLLQAYDGMRSGRDTSGLARQLPAERPGERIFLIDPLGNVMLRFPADPDALGMSRDLARLLKVSHAG